MTEPGMAVPAVVERVARALAMSQGADPDCLAFVGQPQHGPRNTIMVPGAESWQSPRPLWQFYVGDARAAIEVMKVPTQTMLDEGPIEPYMDAFVWAKMIDAALKGEG